MLVGGVVGGVVRRDGGGVRLPAVLHQSLVIVDLLGVQWRRIQRRRRSLLGGHQRAVVVLRRRQDVGRVVRRLAVRVGENVVRVQLMVFRRRRRRRCRRRIVIAAAACDLRRRRVWLLVFDGVALVRRRSLSRTGR